MTTATKTKTVAQAIAETLSWLDNLRSPSFKGESRCLDVAEKRLATLEGMLPSGSGIDNGTTIAPESTPIRLVLNLNFHHMNDSGMYDGWTEHTAIVTPVFTGSGFDIRITGRNRNEIKDYLADTLYLALSADAPIE